MRVDTIAIPTARRPTALARCIRSYAGNALQYGRRPAFLVCDDSTGQQDGVMCRDVVRQAASACNVRLHYIGMTEKVSLLRTLLKARAVPPDVVRFAFFDVEQTGASTCGANRNVLLFHTHGQAILMVDDDTICQTHRPLEHTEEIVVWNGDATGVRDPSEWWPLGSAGREDHVCRAEPLDCLGEQERWLGSGAALTDPPPRGVLEPARSWRAAITVNSMVGDCGWGSPTSYLLLRGPSLERLTASDEVYEDHTTSRAVMRGVRSPTICPQPDFMSTFIGLDNTIPLPPLMPVCRGADHVFAALVGKLVPGAVSVHLQVVLAHRPERPRRFWRGEITRSASAIDLCTLLCTLIDTAPDPGGASVPGRFVELGKWLADLAARPAPEFAEYAASVVRARLERRIEAFEVVLDSLGQRSPKFRRDVTAYLERVRAACGRADVYVPIDLCCRQMAENTADLVQRLVLRYGELITYWPTLLELARGASVGRAREIGPPRHRPAAATVVH